MSIHGVLFLLYFLIKVFLLSFIPREAERDVDMGLTLIGLALILVGLKRLFFSKKGVKSIDEITAITNAHEYIKLSLLLSITRLESLSNVGNITYLSISLFLLGFCLVVMLSHLFAVVQQIFTKQFNSKFTVFVAHLIFAYLLFTWSKQTYVKYYGIEAIGSFLEKTDYRATYLLKMSSSPNFKNARSVIAKLHVFSEEKENNYPREDYNGNYSYESYEAKNIVIEKLYLPEDEMLHFDECNLSADLTCTDQNGEWWYFQIEKKL